MKYHIASASLVGDREENQDCYKYAETGIGFVAVICDGMGGIAGGKEAAELAVNTIFNKISHTSGIEPIMQLSEAISKANLYIFKESIKNTWLSGMGTTVAALLINDGHAYFFHVGDSRIYHLRDQKILNRTFDHSRVFEMVQLGLISEEEARVSPMSNIITKVLGTDPAIEVTISPSLAYRNGDRFLLCSDGIWGALPENEMIRIASLKKPVQEVIEQLMSFISSQDKKEGIKQDNMTAILIETLDQR